ncbi:hypothetical protein [Mycobacterium marinum]|uniref:hypothetical protein n=1 Tax=Mycobacterium marinum TaxID=1781 RepID=UPI00115C6AE0|nr:hypothetical protein [Mycobacterium marinum]WCS18471.1 hypothetical protein MML61_00600 [Mycobacterium marinum]
MHRPGGRAAVSLARPTALAVVLARSAINCFWRPTGTLFRRMLALMGSASVREIDVVTPFCRG